MEQKEKGYGVISVEEILTLLWRNLWKIVLAALLAATLVFAVAPHGSTVSYIAEQELLVLENRVWDSMLYPDLKAARTVMLSNSVVRGAMEEAEYPLSEAAFRYNLSVTTADNALIRVRLWADTEEDAALRMESYLKVAVPAVETTMDSMTVKYAGQTGVSRWVQKSSAGKYSVYAALAGAFLAALCLLYGELFDRRVKDERAAALCTGLPVLGVIPELPSERRTRGDTPHPLDASGLSPAYTEAFRSLRASLNAQMDETVKSLVFAPVLSEEDAVNTALNLAISLGRSGKRVTVADCDLQRGGLAACLPAAPDKGMAELLCGSAQLAECRVETPWQGVSAITAGQCADTEELVAGSAMGEALNTLERDSDLLVIIAPPAALSADAAVLASLAGGTVLVQRARHARQETVKLAGEKLTAAGGHLLGTVLTRLNPRRVYSPNGYVQSFRESNRR